MTTLEQEQRLLWTGGWDSTFQLLRLLLLNRQRVIPFYLLDAERDSLQHEIRAMKYIKARLLREYPHTEELLEPTRYFAVEDIEPDFDITEAFVALSEHNHIGYQYAWLARFCKQNGLTDVQLCIDAGDSRAFRRLKDLVTEVQAEPQRIYRVDARHKGEPEWVLFRYFLLPVFDLSKLQMETIALDHGWHGIMRMTWFCHDPVGDDMPCGRCFPCLSVIEEELGWRIPLSRRILTALPRTIKRLQR